MKATIISASAGTGKTYTMSINFIKQINRGVKYDEILVITFTKKATFEIKQRILKFLKIIVYKLDGYESLEKSINEKINYEILEKAYIEMMKNSDMLKISTIDSFLNKLFKNIIAPFYNIYNYEILDSNNDSHILEIINEIYNLKEFEELFKINNYNKIDRVEKEIRLILSKKIYLYNLLDTEEDLIEENLNFDKYDLKNMYNELYDFSIENNVELVKGAITLRNNLFFEIKDGFNIYDKRKIKKVDEKIKLYIDEKQNELIKKYTKLKINELFKYNKLIRKFAKKCYEIDFDIKMKNKKFTFDDILFFTNKFLFDKKNDLVSDNRANFKLYNMLGEKYNCIMIDEFQDTSFFQFKVFIPFINSADRLYIVGDEKQAIYAFRGGNKNLFTNIEKILKSYNKNIEIERQTLNTCFRTDGKIIDYINNRFSNIDGFDYEDVLANTSNGFVKINNADTFLDSLKNDIKVNGHFNNTAIIVRDNKKIAELSKELSKEFKINSLSSKKLFDNKNVQAILSLVNYILYEKITDLLIFLRSDIMKFTLKMIEEFLNKGKIYNSIIEKIENIKNNNSFKNDYLDNFGYGVEELSEILNIDKILNIIDSCKNLYDFFDSIEKFKNENLVNLREKKGITILTIHKSKGLEFDNVYALIETKKQRNTARFLYLYDENFNIKSYIFFKSNFPYTLDENLNKYFELFNKEEKEQIDNQIYVQLTRPKKSLFIYESGQNEEEIGNLVEKEVLENKNNDIEMFDLELFNKTNYAEKSFNKKAVTIKGEKIRKNGIATHYFMENIITIDDIEFAKSMFYKKYSNLIGPAESENIINKCIKYINANIDKFSGDFEVFNEREIFDSNNNKFIIDRLSVDHNNKKIIIYDYKTMKDPDKNINYLKQVENYKKIISEEYVDYSVYTELISII